MDDRLATKSEDVGLIVRAISFQDEVMIHQRHRRTDRQTDRQTDGQTTSHSKTALCSVVHRAVKNETNKESESLSDQPGLRPVLHLRTHQLHPLQFFSSTSH